MITTLPKLYLASQSSRRQILLHQIGVPFEMLLQTTEEDPEALEVMLPDVIAATYVYE